MSRADLAEQLAFKIMKTCKGHDVIPVFAALESVMEGAFEQVDHAGLRNRLAARLFHMLLSLPVFNAANKAEQAEGLGAVSQIADEDRRVSTILAQVKRLVDLSPPLGAYAAGKSAPRLKAIRKAALARYSLKRRRIPTQHQHAWGIEEIESMEQLVHYFVTAATSEPVSVVLAASAMAAKELISKIELKAGRDFHTLFQVFMLASTAEKAAEADLALLQPILNALSSIPAQETRDAAVLAWIKGLADAWMEKWDGTEGEGAERNPDLEPT